MSIALFLLGVWNGAMALVNAHLYVLNRKRYPRWMKFLVLSTILVCTWSFVDITADYLGGEPLDTPQ